MKDAFQISTWMISSDHLVRWTELNKRESEQVFPALIRRLLDATPEATEISMPSDNSIVKSGYDGSAFLTSGSKLLPSGKLVFEIGTNKDIKGKANKDFESRRSTAAADVTFVFATPRKWQGKEDWAALRRSEKLFKDVRVLDADDFEHWLQLAPMVQIWFSEFLDIDLLGAESLSAWWARFSGSTSPALPNSLYLAGREGEVRQFSDFVEGKPGQLVIESASSDDILGFLTAVFDERIQNQLPDPVIVESDVLWKHICSLPGPGVLIPTFESPEVQIAIGSGKHVVLIKDESKSRLHTPEVFLPRVDRSGAEKALVSAGFSSEEAGKLAVLARRSLPAFKRRVSLMPEERSLVWTDPSSASTLSKLLVAGRWCESPGDFEVLEELTDLDTAEVTECLSNLRQGSDPVLLNSGRVWSFVSAEEAFIELLPRFNFRLQETWVSIATKVLSEPDPLEGLDQLERALSGLPGRVYSSVLRRGVAESIAIVASVSTGNSVANGIRAVSDRVVAEVLRRVRDPNDGLSWIGITDVLPILAEASPEAFLLALEEDLANEDPTVAILFEELSDPLRLGPSAHYPALLGALEVLCWSPEFVARSIRILAQLADFPLVANLANSPVASMGSVLCGWLPRNQLDNELRGELLTACYAISPKTARALLHELWPSNQWMVFGSYRPRFRDWLTSSEQVTYGQLAEFIDLLADKAIEWATDEPSYLEWLIEAVETSSSIEASNRLIDYLETRVISNSLGVPSCFDLLAYVSAAVDKHERYSDASWAMPFELRKRFKRLCALLDPSGDHSRALNIFAWDSLLDGLDSSDAKYQDEIDRKRCDVVEQILATPDGWNVLEEITKRAEDAGAIGRALSCKEGLKTLGNMTRWLESDDRNLNWAAKTWVGEWLLCGGPEVVNMALELGSLSGVARTKFVHCIPKVGTYWDVLAAWPDEYSEYWQSGWFDVIRAEDLSQATQELLRRNRGSTAAIIVAHALDAPRSSDEEEVDVELVISSLRGAIVSRGDLQRLDAYQVGAMLNYLEQKSVGQETLAALEYAFFSWLEGFHEPKALNLLLATDPTLFVKLVCLAFKGRNEIVCERTQESDRCIVEAAWSVVNGWTGFPGRNDDGSANPRILECWVVEARKKLHESDRADIGDQMIGRSFVNALEGKDGIWPEEPIRDLVESLASQQIETGMIIGQMNARGVTSRGIYEGGTQERDLADHYLENAKSIEIRWPRTAAVLREIGRQYERDAAHEDVQAEVAQDFN